MTRAALITAIVLLCGCPAVEQAPEPGAGEPVTREQRLCGSRNELSVPAGFCVSVFAAGVGPARHLAVTAQGDVYVALRGDNDGMVALRDSDGDHRADQIKRFGEHGGTGVGLYDGYLYLATTTAILRYALSDGSLLPDPEPEVVVAGFIEQRSHAQKSVTFDDDDGLFVNIGAPSNACQNPGRTREAPGLDPCPERDRQAGIWRYAATTIGQDAYSDGQRYAAGIRNALANDWQPRSRRLFAVQHGRDQLDDLWPALYSAQQRAELPAEEFLDISPGDDFGWPYCYYDGLAGQKVLAPEYGGDGRTVGRCAGAKDPVVAFPAHWAPNDLQFYSASAFPAQYHGGGFVAFHGSWNRAPLPQAGFLVAFVPFQNGNALGTFDVFADGFAGAEPPASPGNARYRPTGVALGPDGSLYVSDSRVGRIWKIRYALTAYADDQD